MNMKFEEASKQPEGTKFDITSHNGGGWLNCHFKNGFVEHLGGKLAACMLVFESDFKIVNNKD